MNHSTVTWYSFFFIYILWCCMCNIKRLSELSCRWVCPETEPVQLLPFQLCFSSLWRLCLKAPSGPGDAWCHCWGCWWEHPPPTLGTTAAGKKTGQCNFKKDLFSCCQMLNIFQILCFEDDVTTPKNFVLNESIRVPCDLFSMYILHINM